MCEDTFNLNIESINNIFQQIDYIKNGYTSKEKINFIFIDSINEKEVIHKAKLGDIVASKYLEDYYNLKIYTHEEILEYEKEYFK